MFLDENRLQVEFFRNGHRAGLPGRLLLARTALLVAKAYCRKGDNRMVKVYDKGEAVYKVESTESKEFYRFTRFELGDDTEIPSECEECGHTRHAPGRCQGLECYCGVETAIEEMTYVN